MLRPTHVTLHTTTLHSIYSLQTNAGHSLSDSFHLTSAMEEDHRDIEAGGEKVEESLDTSLSPDESMVEPISESCDCEDEASSAGGEYEKSATLQMKDPEKDSVAVKDNSINKYKKKFK